MVRALQLEEQVAKELVIVVNLREDKRRLKTQSLSESLSEEEVTYEFFCLLVGEHGRSCGGGHTKVDISMATNTRRWISFSDRSSGAVMVPAQGALLTVISQRRRGAEATSVAERPPRPNVVVNGHVGRLHSV
jgi:hypothetical protein